MKKNWTRPLTIATRGSRLALVQAELVKKALEAVVPEVKILTVTTKGDRDRISALVKIGGDGLFVRGVERELLEGRADLAVHCGKDLPFEISDGLTIAGVPRAADARDMLLMTEETARRGGPSRIGTGSPRRVTELARLYPDAETIGIRGNITTRLERLRDGTCDGLILAKAGVDRLHPDLTGLTARVFDFDEMIPAACQGILALECREEDRELAELLESLSDPETEERFRIERRIFRRLRADCTKPVGIHAGLREGRVELDLYLNGHRTHLTAEHGQEDRLTEAAARALLGHVTLVGAGCGRGLITEQGIRAVRRADVLVYDALMDEALLSETKAGCERIYAGKRAGSHYRSQDEINRLLIDKASGGREVVRLKGGDSFVFGRGGEEIKALHEAGIACSVIPGVTSAVAVPESFGLPVTERGIARSFTVITGHTAAGTEDGADEEDYGALARLRGTLVFLMARGSLGRITSRLIEEGKKPGTPASVLSSGFTASAERNDGSLENIAEKAAEAPTPVILVVGETAGLHLPVEDPEEAGVLASEETEKTGLFSAGVTVAGTPHIVSKMSDALAARGIRAVPGVSLRAVPDPEQVPDTFAEGSWVVFTSANGVDVCFDELRRRGTDLRCFAGVRFAVIGEGTEEALLERGFRADFRPSVFTGKCLGRELAERILKEKDGEVDRPAPVVLLRADRASKTLPAELAASGVSFEDRPVYSLCPVSPDGAVRTWDERTEDKKTVCRTGTAVFLSALGAKAYLMDHGLSAETALYAIGPVTAEKVRSMTGRVPRTPGEYTVEALADLIASDRKN